MTSGGLGTMGYGLPAAMGVQIAHPDALVVDIAGEASILMNIQELSTIAQYRLPVKVFILNNQYMGMVRQWQELLHGGRYSQSYIGIAARFREAGRGVPLRGPARDENVASSTTSSRRCSTIDSRRSSPISWSIKKENCFPMIPSGAAHNEMLLGPADKQSKPTSERGWSCIKRP